MDRRRLRRPAPERAGETPAVHKRALATKPKKAATGVAKIDPAVADMLRVLRHPLKTEIEAVRLIILAAADEIGEGVKWNAPSFRTEKDWFATIHLRSKESVELILFVGVKKRSGFKKFKLADPNGLVKWLAEDRALVTLGAGRNIPDNRKAVEAIVRAWIKHL